MEKHFFLFTIGPVQTFIGEARKTQDLYGGSLLLSYLMEKAMATVIEYKGHIIFPDEQLKESIPNRVLAIIDPSDVAQIAEDTSFKSEVEIVKWFGNHLADNVKALLIAEGNAKLMQTGNGQDKVLLSAWERQLKNHLEIYWAAYPSADYKQGFAEVHRRLGAVKHSRSYNQWEEQGRKCNLDGIRNALIYRANSEGENKKLAYYADAAIFIENSLLEKGEGLSALSFTKRRFKYNPQNSFDSTTEIALMHCLPKLKEISPDLKSKIKCLGDINTQLYYEENTMEPMVSKILKDANSGYGQPWIRDCQKAISEAASQHKLLLSKYYSLVLFDGDDMGKWWNGSEELVAPGTDLTKFHEALSDALAAFSKQAKDILELEKGKRGRLVYAGGDDFLGFVNLEYLVDVLRELRERFDHTINGAIEPYLAQGKRMSFSAGVQIAHYKEPLRLVMKAVHHAESKAKKWRTKKDACCIATLRASGEPSEFVLPFHTKAGDSTLAKVARLNQLLAQYFSSKTTDKIGQELGRFPLGDTTAAPEVALLWPKFWNALVRSCLLPAAAPNYNAVLNEVMGICKELAQSVKDWDNMVTLLDTCDFLIRHTGLQFTKEKENDAATAN